MNPIFQNTGLMNHAIQKYGCRFRCLQAIAEFEEQKALSETQIIESYKTLSKINEIMNVSCLCGSQEHKIINRTFSLLGEPKKKGVQIGKMIDNVPIGWDKKICQFDYIILHWRTQTSDGHYTLADKNGVEIFDPWDNSKNYMTKINVQRKLLYRVWRVE